MSIALYTEAAAAILEFDHLTRLLEEEARANKKNGWVEACVEEFCDDLPINTTMAQRKRTLSRLVELGYWRRDVLNLEGYEIDQSEQGYAEEEIAVYYYPLKWLFTQDVDQVAD